MAANLSNLYKSSGADPTHIEVLQNFYATCYYKNEGQVKEADANLGEAIQVAMSLGMHEDIQDSVLGQLGEFELDMRKRTFWNLYTWDR